MDQGVINKGLKSAKIVFFGQKNLVFLVEKDVELEVHPLEPNC